jgi:hypothetical protein
VSDLGPRAKHPIVTNIMVRIVNPRTYRVLPKFFINTQGKCSANDTQAVLDDGYVEREGHSQTGLFREIGTVAHEGGTEEHFPDKKLNTTTSYIYVALNNESRKLMSRTRDIK